MAFFQKFPYSDEHQLNLDWIARLLTKFKGGSPGEVLSKRSSKDYDFIWTKGVGDYEIVDHTADLATVTKNYALVLHNDSIFGDGGPCWMEVLDYANVDGYTNANGDTMYPMLDQSAVVSAAAPIKNMWGVISSYLERNDLIYGNNHTLFEPVTTNEIDCGSFVAAVLNGIPYSESKYNTANSKNNRTVKISDFGIDHNRSLGHKLSFRFAQYMAEHKWLHSMPDAVNVCNTLQFGDLLFINHNEPVNAHTYLHVGHIAIVLAVFPNNSRVIVAEGGSSPIAMTEQRNTNDVCKISTLHLNDANIQKYCSAFARIPLNNDDAGVNTIPLYNPIADGFELTPVMIPNCFIETTHGFIDYSSRNSVSVGFVEVQPGSTIKNAGTTSSDYHIEVAEYDDKLHYLGNTSFRTSDVTLTNNTHFIRLIFGHDNNTDPILLSELATFKAVIKGSAGGNYIPAPASPATGAFLVWDGNAWIAQTLSTWQGGNY